MEGRDNQTDGSVLAQDFLVDQLGQFTEPVDGDSLDGYGYPFAAGTNLIGQIPGGDLADEYVVLGAHYDHLGSDCPSDTPGDDICNGAGDDASGVATVLEVGRLLAADAEPPPRTVILALWDAEEDGLLGSEAYIADPAVPLDDTVAYLNWDIQGSNLSPSLANTTVVVGAETGGPNLDRRHDGGHRSLVAGHPRPEPPLRAGPQRSRQLRERRRAHRLLHRRQHALLPHVPGRPVQPRLRQAGPADPDRRSADPGHDVHRRPAGVRRHGAPATYDDAVSMLGVVSAGQPDFDLFDEAAQATAEQFLADLNTMVDAGPEAFDDDAVSTLLGGSVDIVESLSTGECDGFLD